MALGWGALYGSGGSVSANNNVAVGRNSMASVTSANNNVANGYYSMNSLSSGTYNSGLGSVSLQKITTGNYNVGIGAFSGYNTTTGSGNIFLGYKAGYDETGSDKLYIHNNETSSPLIYGNFTGRTIGINGKLGIGTMTPSYSLEVSDGNVTSIYASGAISADNFIDRTPAYTGISAIQDIMKIKDDGKGNIDHETLPIIAKIENITIPVYKEIIIQHPNTQECLPDYEYELVYDKNNVPVDKRIIRNLTRCTPVMAWNETKKVLDHYEIKDGRSIGGMVTIQTSAIQELKTEIDLLKSELCLYNNRYSWCP
jgi:hypothetical protein